MNQYPMEVRLRDERDWEAIRWPGETGKMLLAPGAHHPLHRHDFDAGPAR